MKFNEKTVGVEGIKRNPGKIYIYGLCMCTHHYTYAHVKCKSGKKSEGRKKSYMVER